jgi:hypothetical protein
MSMQVEPVAEVVATQVEEQVSTSVDARGDAEHEDQSRGVSASRCSSANPGVRQRTDRPPCGM